MIRLRGICRTYWMGDQEVRALDNVDLHIEANEMVAIVGSSGSGKSTLMNILGCLDQPSSGTYTLNGGEVAGFAPDELARVRNKDIGFIFQSFHLLPRASAIDNVAQPLIYRGIKPKQRRLLAGEALARVGLAERMHHLPNELSGGQRQRVAIARALVGQPAILLADEPTGNLDSHTSESILTLIEELHAGGQTVIIVTHEPTVAERCQRVVRLQNGQIVSDSKAP